ncbi:hypothetical protein [Microcoleus sp. bin38.metabat.b11b12b14.051]|uniref:hypothetical protein n=1 Tax=Microcoleus sp. bin38.metabat.b11b12b14.051 TaxID=2742709 RepID=UPI0025CC703E|nr:hypothetical protein [Microcoleus sp. bin38.metabat.b11b12b14.051]
MVNVTIERPIALLNRRYTRMDADGGKVDRSFEPQMHADGRGWGKGDRTFEPQMHADGRGWAKGRSHSGSSRTIKRKSRLFYR